MRFILALILLLSVTTAVAQDDPFLAGDALQAEIAKSCAEGCVTFSREHAAEFEAQLKATIAQREDGSNCAAHRPKHRPPIAGKAFLAAILSALWFVGFLAVADRVERRSYRRAGRLQVVAILGPVIGALACFINQFDGWVWSWSGW